MHICQSVFEIKFLLNFVYNMIIMNQIFNFIVIFPLIQGLNYYGTIREDAQIGENVIFNLPIYVRNKEDLPQAEICGYTIYKEKIGFPFKIVLLEPMTGSAKIIVAKKLDYEMNKKYSFEISAHDCSTNFISPNHFKRESVDIDIIDVNDNHPYFEEGVIKVDIDEKNDISENITCLKVIDEDETKQFSSICSFKITTPDVLFMINSKGCVSSLKHLSAGLYSFVVIAFDCEGLVSDEATVHIKVHSVCKPSWKFLAENINFSNINSKIAIFPSNVSLNACTESCSAIKINMKIKIQYPDYKKTICSLTRQNIQLRRKQCEINNDLVDLLPSLNEEGKMSLVFGSDTGPIEISKDAFDAYLGVEFTIIMWMRHRDIFKDEDSGRQQILCHSDAQDTERRHYMLYIENCKLVLHMQPTLLTMSKSRVPIEWHFKLMEVCDNVWHHYAVMMRQQQIELYVDGMEIVLSDENMEIVSDWPFHKKYHIQETRLVVGACWNGKFGHMDEYFYGELAELSVIEGHTKKKKVPTATLR